MSIPQNERERARQSEVDRLQLQSFTDTALEDIARLAAGIFETPIALVSIIDKDRQWFKTRIGLDVDETPREWAFCAHAIERPDQVMVVEDASLDPRFAQNPLVTAAPSIRFYAGAPLVSTSGHAIGTVCVIDHKPKTPDPEALEQLRFLAQQVMVRLEEKRGRPLA